jgi:hypothetical protein
MFGILESITKAAVGVIITPVAVIADVVTLGGQLTDKQSSYTVDSLSTVAKNLEDAVKPSNK